MDIMLLLVAVAPVILIGWFLYKKDKEKESTGLLFKLFIGGVASSIPTLIIGSILGSFFPEMEYMNFIEMFIYAFIVVALVEESCKWFFLYKISYDNHEFDTLYDMILYAAFVALGFACLENILYVWSYGFYTGLIRAVSAVPGHVCDGILMGSNLALAKHNQVKGNLELEKKYKRMSIIVPMIAHGIYDFCLFLDNRIFLLLFVLFVIYLFVTSFQKVKEVSQNDVNIKFKNKFCPGCGKPVKSNFCQHCGRRNE